MSVKVIQQAQAFISSKNYDEAIQLLSTHLETLSEIEQKTEQTCKILEILGQCYYLQKDADNAINYFTQVRILRERPDRRDSDQLQFTYNYLGLAYKLKNSQEHYKLAINCFEKYLNLQKEAGEGQQPKTLLNLGICYKGSGELDKALEILQQAKLLNDKSINAQELQMTQAKIINNIGLCYKEKLMFDEALESFQQADQILKSFENDTAEINKELGLLYLNIGNTNFMKKNFGEARTYYELAREKTKSQRMLQFIVHKLVLCNQQIGEYEQAEQYCTQDIELIKKVETKEETKKKLLITSYTIMSQVYQLQNKYEEAIKYQKMCIDLDSSEIKKIQMLALYKEAIENENQAMLIIYYLENTLNIYKSILPPSHPNLVILLEKIGRAYFDQDNFTLALEKALECCSLEPNYKFAIQLAGVCQQKLENLDEALRFYEECIQLDSYYADPYIGILEIQLEKKQYQQTIDRIESIWALQPTSYDIELSKSFIQRLQQYQQDSQQFSQPFRSRTIETMEDCNLSKDEKFQIEPIPTANFTFNDPGVKAKLRFFNKKAQRLLDEEKQEKEEVQVEQSQQEQELQKALEIQQEQNYSQEVINEQRGVCAATCKQCIIF